ncbi:MAG: RES family NAD+ phosphorylase [Rhodospirillaceae bacterium]|nr:RES family NAD+ phosphorylase [Rhodospirillaceae bacterium]
MSLRTWTPGALSSEARRYKGRGWRLVEAQHRVSTLKLVDTLAEQAVLEQLIEETKPVVPPECRHLDYLLSTPFRYGAPYPRGSRFRRASHTPGVFYASEQTRTAVAEIAFHRLLFFAESPDTPWPDAAAEYTAFAVALATDRAIDLTAPPLEADRALWTSPADYAPCQALAEAARTTDIALIRYESVRDPEHGANLAVLTCKTFARPKPVDHRTWHIRLAPGGVQALCKFPSERIELPPQVFANDPRLAQLRWKRR